MQLLLLMFKLLLQVSGGGSVAKSLQSLPRGGIGSLLAGLLGSSADEPRNTSPKKKKRKKKSRTNGSSPPALGGTARTPDGGTATSADTPHTQPAVERVAVKGEAKGNIIARVRAKVPRAARPIRPPWPSPHLLLLRARRCRMPGCGLATGTELCCTMMVCLRR